LRLNTPLMCCCGQSPLASCAVMKKGGVSTPPAFQARGQAVPGPSSLGLFVQGNPAVHPHASTGKRGAARRLACHLQQYEAAHGGVQGAAVHLMVPNRQQRQQRPGGVDGVGAVALQLAVHLQYGEGGGAGERCESEVGCCRVLQGVQRSRQAECWLAALTARSARRRQLEKGRIRAPLPLPTLSWQDR
jgi:hypothetical protein